MDKKQRMKKRAKELAEKTGMSYQAALQQLNAEREAVVDDEAPPRFLSCQCGHYIERLTKIEGDSEDVWWCAACGRLATVEESEITTWWIPNHNLEGVSREQEIADEQTWLDDRNLGRAILERAEDADQGIRSFELPPDGVHETAATDDPQEAFVAWMGYARDLETDFEVDRAHKAETRIEKLVKMLAQHGIEATWHEAFVHEDEEGGQGAPEHWEIAYPEGEDKRWFKRLSRTEDPYENGIDSTKVDWEAVHDLRHRAPRHVTFPEATTDRWDQGEWVYVNRDGTLRGDEMHVTALGYVDADTAAIYRRALGRDSELYWQRRWLYTGMLTRDEQKQLK